jgi:hypothetical protein
MTTAKASSRHPRTLHESTHVGQENRPATHQPKRRPLIIMRRCVGFCFDSVKFPHRLRSLFNQAASLNRTRARWSGHRAKHGAVLPSSEGCEATADSLFLAFALRPNTQSCDEQARRITGRIIRSYMGCAVPQISFPRLSERVGLRHHDEEISPR